MISGFGGKGEGDDGNIIHLSIFAWNEKWHGREGARDKKMRGELQRDLKCFLFLFLECCSDILVSQRFLSTYTRVDDPVGKDGVKSSRGIESEGGIWSGIWREGRPR